MFDLQGVFCCAFVYFASQSAHLKQAEFLFTVLCQRGREMFPMKVDLPYPSLKGMHLLLQLDLNRQSALVNLPDSFVKFSQFQCQFSQRGIASENKNIDSYLPWAFWLRSKRVSVLNIVPDNSAFQICVFQVVHFQTFNCACCAFHLVFSKADYLLF